jgi:hypothetical protein
MLYQCCVLNRIVIHYIALIFFSKKPKGLRSGEVTPSNMSSSRPGSSMSNSTTASGIIRRSNVGGNSAPRKPRPASIAVTGVSLTGQIFCVNTFFSCGVATSASYLPAFYSILFIKKIVKQIFQYFFIRFFSRRFPRQKIRKTTNSNKISFSIPTSLERLISHQ